MGKLTTATRVFRTQGTAGVMSALKDRYLNNWVGRRMEWCYGKAIELRGNTIEIDGCTFSLDNPTITTGSKSKFMFGQYERPERDAVRRFVDPAIPVVEFGGSIGVISCLTNRKLVAPQRHVVVEANPALVPLLQANRDRNQCRFTILPRLVAYGSAQAPFYADSANFVIGSAVPSEAGSAVDILEVQTIDLRTILDQYQFERCTLICDIEGGESDLVRYESAVLRERVTALILEVHEWSLGRERVGELLREIVGLGFACVYSEADTYTFQKGGLPKGSA
jgi:FkbM family methyltransferase